MDAMDPAHRHRAVGSDPAGDLDGSGRVADVAGDPVPDPSLAIEALERITQQQPRALGYIRREGFVFDGNLVDYEGWKKLAFSLYSDLCEVDSIARNALKEVIDTDQTAR